MLASWLIGFYDPIFANLLTYSRLKSVQEFLHFIGEKKAFEHAWRNEVWEDGGFDAIIAPVQALPAIPHQYVHLATSTRAPLTYYPVQWGRPARTSCSCDRALQHCRHSRWDSASDPRRSGEGCGHRRMVLRA
jgi:hypothetical protein